MCVIIAAYEVIVAEPRAGDGAILERRIGAFGERKRATEFAREEATKRRHSTYVTCGGVGTLIKFEAQHVDGQTTIVPIRYAG